MAQPARGRQSLRSLCPRRSRRRSRQLSRRTRNLQHSRRDGSCLLFGASSAEVVAPVPSSFKVPLSRPTDLRQTPVICLSFARQHRDSIEETASEYIDAMHSRAIQNDVLIVGAGPAGLACAIAAAREGLYVVVIDASKPPIDKACGEGLLPGSLEALGSLGFDLNHDFDQIESAVLRGVRFIGNSVPSMDFVTAQAAFPANPGRW